MLWLGFLLTVPLPLLGFGALIPVARFLLLAAVTAGLIVAEGMGLVPAALLAIFVLHALVYAGLLWLLALLISRGLARLSWRSVGPATVGLVAACLIIAAAFELYVTPFAPVSPRASLLHVLE
jgi:hypothetical protein